VFTPQAVQGASKSGRLTVSGDVVPETKEWQAVEAEPNESGGHFLSVSGEIKLGNTNEIPHLILADPPLPSSDQLMLELKIVPEGPSHFEWQWKRARILHSIRKGQYKIVRVIWQGVEVATLHPG
jgi:hypothetical protein